MEKYKHLYELLERNGFERITLTIGNIDYRHPKNKKYVIAFDWDTLNVFFNSYGVYQTMNITETELLNIIQHVVYLKSSSKQFSLSFKTKFII
jgi:hypothetical protein